MASPDEVFTADLIQAATGVGVLGGGPLSAPRVMADLCNPALTLGELTQVMSQEPGLVARVLRVANSAYYGVARHVATLDRALVILGLDTVRSIAAAACLDRGLMQATVRAGIDRIAFVRHSLAVAVGAEQVALKRHRGLASEAFIAGLLHNLGIPLQGVLHPEGPSRLARALLETPHRAIRELEAAVGLPGHESCGAVVLGAWNLPPALVEAVRHHHDPMAAREPHRKLATVVHLGLELAARTGHSFNLEPPIDGPCGSALMRLGMTAEELDEVVQDLPRRVMAFRRALQDD
ncbi:MAG: hypothetical protein RL026_781 [Pseudomonadota bacterium]|jgi:HD-like signal output (HDOD) protein